MITDLPVYADLFFYVSLASLIAGLIVLLLLVFKRLANAVRSGSHGSGFIKSFFQFSFVLVWIGISAFVLLLSGYAQSYRTFTKKELAAVVKCIPIDSVPGGMQLRITFIKNGEPQGTERYVLKGDQWTVEGDILKWDERLNLLGIHTMYRLTRIRGRYLDVREEVEKTPSVYDLTDEKDSEWRRLYDYGYRLPLVEAVYGNSAFTYPSREKTFEIYVTTSGIMAKVRE